MTRGRAHSSSTEPSPCVTPGRRSKTSEVVMRRLWLFVCAMTLAAAAPRHAVLAAQAPAKHMLYRVRGPHGATVYLLGSVHLLTPEAGKLPPVVDTAFDHAKSIALETSLDSLQMRAPEMLAIARLAPGSTLRSVLPPALATTTDSLLHLYGLSIDQVAMFKPWFVSMLMTQLAVQKAGYQADWGVDAQLNKRAHDANKPVIGLESVDFQLHLFDSFPLAVQEHMLASGKGPEQSVADLNVLKDAWLAGNAAEIDSVTTASGDTPPEMLDALIYKRNASWIPKIEEMIKGTSDVLVIVGAAHLVGKNGVVAMLRAKGYTVEQL